MNKSHRAFATIFLMIFLASAILPIAFKNQPVTTVTLVDTPHLPATTDYQVSVSVFNFLQEFNDDDFKFTVLNGSTPLNGAWVRLFNASDLTPVDDDYTDGNGVVIFYNLPQGTYQWNVSHASDPDTPDKTGQIVSNGPEASTSIMFGNLDWDNDEDDLNATIVDVEGNPANNLNFSIHFSGNDSIWAQKEVIDGEADFQDIPDGDYIWKLSVLDDPYYGGYQLDWGSIEANSTQKLVHQSIGPLTGNPDYYDLEVFTYFETSFQPIVGAVVNVTYKNGTAYDLKTTSTNGTVVFVDLPIEFMNWSVTYLGLPIGLGDYYFNFSAPSADIRSPIITSPGNQDVLIDSENVTITWHIEDEYPSSIEVYIDGSLNSSLSWVNSTYDYSFNVSAAFSEFVIGEYDVKLVVYDQNSNSAEDTINLRIYEDVIPTLEGPDDLEFYFTTPGQTLSWNITDDYVNMYTLMDGNDTYSSGTINPDEPIITVSLDGLAIGVHNFTLYANDTSGNTATDSVIVTVNSDNTPPVIVFTPEDILYRQGDINVIRNWTATDDFKDYYTIVINDVEVVHEDWTSENIEFDFSGLLVGVHEVTLTVYDIGGNSVQSSVTVIVSQSYLVEYMTAISIGAIGVIAVIAIVWFVRYR